VMDRAFARVEGLFGSYAESVAAFARANYALYLEGGRCPAMDPAVCGGRYRDPDGMYREPVVEVKTDYAGDSQRFDGRIPGSYGADMIEVTLDRRMPSQAVTITLHPQNAVARFNLQVWQLGLGGFRRRALTAEPETAVQSGAGNPAEANLYIDRTQSHWLALIITRVDANEKADPIGGYRITVSAR
jgi:hypothetical protein